jgi:hypothetical protein
MPNLSIAATDRSPEVEFDFDQHRLRLRGESYPEDASALYGPIFQALDAYLGGLGEGDACRLDFELIYFNSSSAKAIMTLLEKLDAAAGRGVGVTITWRYDDEDETMHELGEEFGEDVEHAEFRLEALERPA